MKNVFDAKALGPFNIETPLGKDDEERARICGFLIPHFIVFLLFSYFAFLRNPFGLFWGEEGLSTKLLYREQCLWDSISPFLQMSHHGGIGDQSIGFQTRLMPPLAVQCLAGITDLHPVLAYMFYAAEIFLAVFAFGRAYSFSSRQSLAAAWACAILMLPYVAPNRLIIPVGHIVPFFVETVATMCVLLAAYAQTGRVKSAVANVLLALACAALVIWHTCANPQFSVMAAPFVGLFGLTATALAASKREIAWKIATVAAVFALLVIGRFFNFVLGLAEYSAVHFFPGESQNFQAHLWYGSILFQGPVYSNLAPLMWLAALAGGLLRLLSNNRARGVAIGHLCGMALILIAALILHSPSSTYNALKVVYVEELFWPIYLLHGAAFLGSAWSLTGFANKYAPFSYMKDGLLWRASLIPYAAVAVIWTLSFAPTPEPMFASESATPITDYLAAHIALTPGSTFHGREATFTGYRDKQPGIGWFDLDLPQQFQATRNEHHLAGLWMFNIPTVQDEVAVMSPVLHAVVSRLLARKGDHQGRDILVMTHPDARVLAMIGARFIVSDEDAIAGATQRLTLKAAPNLTLHVFEIDNANVGQYSPVRVEVVHNATELIERLRQGVDTSEVALLDAPLSAKLTPAHDARLTFERGYIDVQAKSDGTSLLILPFEFSHCLRFENADGATLMRANLVNTGVLFSKTLNERLTFAVGPFGAANCRLQDVADLEALGLGDLPN